MLAYALMTNLLLTVFATAGPEPVAVVTADGSGQPVVIAVAGDGAPVIARASADAGDKPRVVMMKRRGASAEAMAADQQAKVEAELAQARAGMGFPKYWIGVRLSEIPAPLAAHVGTKGAMILNVMKGSPADTVGIEQYDIVTAVDGKPLDGPMDLTSALRDKKAGDQVTLNIVRKASDRPIRVTLAERPADQEPEPKYDVTETEEMAFGVGPMQFRGRALRIGPDGKWGIHDLGQLDDLDDMLEELKVHVFDPNDASWQGPHNLFQFTPDGEDRDVAINIVISRDGNTTEIKTDADGKVTVDRKAEDGTESSATYESVDELAEKDPAAAELYNEHVRSQGPRAFIWHGKDGAMGKEFRIEVRRKVEEAMREAEEHMSEAQEQAKEAVERLHEKLAEIHVESRSDDGKTSSSESFVVNQSANGGISVRIIKDGKLSDEYNYASVDQLKKNQPEVYERVKNFIK